MPLIDAQHCSEKVASFTTLSPLSTLQAIFGAGLPLVSSKIVKRIESGEFIEMAELLPERLTYGKVDEDLAKSKSKRKLVTSIFKVGTASVSVCIQP